MSILNGIRTDVRWMLRIGGFVLVVCGAVISLTFPMLRDLVASIADLKQELRLQSGRISVVERNEEKLFAVKEKRDAQMMEILRKLDAQGR